MQFQFQNQKRGDSYQSVDMDQRDSTAAKALTLHAANQGSTSTHHLKTKQNKSTFSRVNWDAFGLCILNLFAPLFGSRDV